MTKNWILEAKVAKIISLGGVTPLQPHGTGHGGTLHSFRDDSLKPNIEVCIMHMHDNLPQHLQIDYPFPRHTFYRDREESILVLSLTSYAEHNFCLTLLQKTTHFYQGTCLTRTTSDSMKTVSYIRR